MSDFLASWGPTFALFAIVLVVVQVGIARQMKLLKVRNDNDAQHTAELQKISQSLDRIASAVEKRS